MPLEQVNIGTAENDPNADTLRAAFAKVNALVAATNQAQSDLGALGAAMTAGVAAGLYPDLAAAAAKMVKVSRVYCPNQALSAVYRRKYQDFRTVVEAMAPVWGRLER